MIPDGLGDKLVNSLSNGQKKLFSSVMKDPQKDLAVLQLKDQKVRVKTSATVKDMSQFSGAAAMGFITLDNTINKWAKMSLEASGSKSVEKVPDMFSGLFGEDSIFGNIAASLGKGMSFDNIKSLPKIAKAISSTKAGMIGGAAASALSLVAGVSWMVMDGISGVKNAKAWGTSKFAAGLGGALAGRKGSVGNALGQAGKYAMVGAGIGGILGTIAPGVGNIIGMAIGGGIGAVAGLIMGAVGGPRLAKAFQFIGDGVVGSVKAVASAMGKAWNWVATGVGKGVEGVKKFAVGIADGVTNTVSNLFQGATGIFNGVLDTFQSGGLAGVVGLLYNTIKDGLSSIVGKIGTFIFGESNWTGIENSFKGMFSFFEDFGTKIKSLITSVLPEPLKSFFAGKGVTETAELPTPTPSVKPYTEKSSPIAINPYRAYTDPDALRTNIDVDVRAGEISKMIVDGMNLEVMKANKDVSNAMETYMKYKDERDGKHSEALAGAASVLAKAAEHLNKAGINNGTTIINPTDSSWLSKSDMVGGF